MRRALAPVLLLALLAGCAQSTAPPAAYRYDPEAADQPDWAHSAAARDERLRQIAQERAEVQAQVARQRQRCYGRFRVNACLAEVRRQSFAQLDALRAQEVAVDDAWRERRARLRLSEIAARQGTAATPAPTSPAP